MKDVNKVILIGRVGADPIQRETRQGVSVVNFPLATSRRLRAEAVGEALKSAEEPGAEAGKQGEFSEETEWHRVVAWGREAESCAQFLRKGQPVYVEGMIRSRKFEAKDGAQRTAFEVHAESVSFLGKMPRARNAATELDSVVGL
jgi:single-strand DNA-binding protein